MTTASYSPIAAQFSERIRVATEAGTPLRLRGGGSKDWYGQAPQGELLDTRAYAGVVSYEPTELVITARCGTPLAEIEALLAQHQQMLAFEPPRYGAASTIGGVVASALSGPRRASAGAVRDFVLGAVLMDGHGEALRFGGQVMKNVAGYDVSRLLAGSLGTLGLILEVSLKVLPVPLREASLRFEMSEIDALRRLNEWAGQPLPISASCWHEGVLSLRLSGAEAAVEAAQRKLGGVALEDDAAFWTSLRDQTHGYFKDGGSLWRLSVPPAASAIILRGEQLIEWGGAQRWLKVEGTDAEQAAGIRRTVAAAGGHATLFRSADKSVGVFHPLAPAVAKIHERLKQSFDPAGIFNPGRMY
ncbi:glycolate oxidase subunit GlcE [Duganella violaceipulchra]|uniref:Glycolate oxidase FAD binding subunit n=1 Tax=Duganella violaceipulchra TaxID=2849652 RepID=A0AA41H9J8_9BURK|nr:glycolate oxidase subunit GlcE [Duganella violaceicalia]MBV6322396.1 glycolate oxidase subunit GlcE [Duganella violaceicalia]MCP2011543.1 glycolate oxidase FAD binding subunit [Duganella violaceicalia]